MRKIDISLVLITKGTHYGNALCATTNFFADSKRPILGLSNEVSFVPESLWKDG